MSFTPNLKLGFGAKAGTPTPGPTYSPEATALFARMSAQPNSTRKTLINNAIVSLTSAGIWTKLDCLYVTAAHDQQAARLNWIGGPTYDLAENGTPTWTLDRGYTGDGIGAYLETNFNPVTATTPKFTQDSGALGVWIGTSVSSNVQYDIGNSNSYICPLSGALASRIRPNVGANQSFTIPATTSVFMTSWSRTDSANYTAYKDGANSATAAVASAALNSSSFLLLAYHAGATPSNFSTRRTQAAFWGQSLTGTEHGNIYTAISTFMTAIGA